ncbi:MAG: septum formation inhibitor Maf [Myxococcales bacterium]|nr:septum formation inhibitor Maf [Myxococcales bacterium]
MSAALTAPLWLASASLRRRELLTQVGVPFRVEPSRAEEVRRPGEDAASFVTRAASDKAAEVSLRLAAAGEGFVLGADTVVVRGDDVLGKPRDDAHALEMLRALSGETHRVITGVSLWAGGSERARTHATTHVVFRALDEDELGRYVALGEGRDKAGAYAVQGVAAGFVRGVEGSYSNVVGLPLAETLELMREAGLLQAWP